MSTSGVGVTRGVAYWYSLAVLNDTCWKYEWMLRDLLNSRLSFIKSPSFQIGENIWSVGIYPLGKKIKTGSSLVVYLKNEQGPPTDVLLSFKVKGGQYASPMGIGTVPKILAQGEKISFSFRLHHASLGRQHPGKYFYVDNILDFVTEVKIGTASDDVLPLVGRRKLNRSRSLVGWVLSKARARCIVCLDRPRTAGYVHDGELHVCVCEACAREEHLLHGDDLRCPLCTKKVENIVYKIV